MAITNTWSINDMQRTDSDGNVFLVYWSCVARNEVTPASGDDPAVYGPESATEGGKLRMDADPSDPDFIPYADLTEATVLGWVYDSLIEGDETADEAKARVEANRTAKVQGQIDRAATTESGMPWVS
jgi:hypothetical protein